MSLKKGFASIILIISLIILSAAGVYLFATKDISPESKPAPEPKTGETLATPSPEPSPSLTPAAIPVQIPKITAISTPTPAQITTGKIGFHIAETTEKACGQYTCIDLTEGPIKMPDRFIFRLLNTQTNAKWEKSAVSDWVVDNLIPGIYKVMIYYKDPYVGSQTTCENCKDAVGIGESWMCGFQIKLSAGESPKLICKYKNPNNFVADTSDKTPPTSNVYWPQAGGSMTYKTDGKYCVYMNAPTDNSPGTIQTRYAFDGNWVSWQESNKTAYACTDNLSNGQHVFSYQSKDLAGNEEPVKSLTFSVAIN